MTCLQCYDYVEFPLRETLRRLNGPAARKLELFMNEDSQHSVATPLRELDTGPFSIGLLSDGSREGPGGPGFPPYIG